MALLLTHWLTQVGNVQLQPRAAASRARGKAQQPEHMPPSSMLPPPSSTGFAQTRAEPESGAIKVSLQDCLACSGCVTSAETVLLEHQSIGELRAKLQVLRGRASMLAARSLSTACHPLRPQSAQQR